MKQRCLAVVPLALLLSAAASEPGNEELVRKANGAFARQEYEAALELYARAEMTSANPGLVAFNKAAALYRLGRYRDAELHYRRCLEESDGEKRSAILFNQGNCLLQQAQAGGDHDLYRQAVACYQNCLQADESAASLRELARYNLELTKLLWLQARLGRGAGEKDGSGSESPKSEPPKQEKTPNDRQKTEVADPGPDPAAKGGSQQRTQLPDKQGKQQPIATTERAAGKGDMQTPPDSEPLQPLAPEDAVRGLEAAADRIRRERSAYMQRASPMPSREVPDW